MLRLKFQKRYSLPQKNETINEDEMRKNIKDYIDYSWELSENIIPLASTTPDKNFTDSDRKNYKN